MLTTMDTKHFAKSLVFFVNGKEVVERNPDPEDTLLQYLRRNLGLTGAKQACGEGGCGSCTVMVSRMNHKTGEIRHYSVNACLTPVVSVHGMSVITVEGLGSVKNKLHPIQEQLAKFHGSQCGFCTPGFIMSMYALLRTNPVPSMEDIEDNLVGNLCRCTGYRPILEGFRSFSSDITRTGCGKENCCRITKGETVECPEKDRLYEQKEIAAPSLDIIFPPKLKILNIERQSIKFEGPRVTWFRPTCLQDLLLIKELHPKAKIVVGNTEVGIDYKFKGKIIAEQINPSEIEEMNCFEMKLDRVIFGASLPLSQLEDHFNHALETSAEQRGGTCSAFLSVLRMFGSKQIRNVAAVGGNIMNGSPVSDLNPLLLCLGATLHFKRKDATCDVDMTEDFFEGYRKVSVANEWVLVSVSVPLMKKNQHLEVYKQSRRRDDDISIVNAAMFLQHDFSANTVQKVTLAFGGMAFKTSLAKKTMQIMEGKRFTDELFDEASSSLLLDFPLDPDAPGSMIQYRKTLTISLLFKFFLSVKNWLHSLDSNKEPLSLKEQESIKAPRHTTMKSTQYTDEMEMMNDQRGIIGQSVLHESGIKHSTGEAEYFDDIRALSFELHAAFVLSTKASALIKSINAKPALVMNGVHAFFSSKDLPDDLNKIGFIVNDEELFASKEVHYHGHVIGLVVAETRKIAKDAAKLVQIVYEEKQPILSIQDAIERKSMWNPISFSVGDVNMGFETSDQQLSGEINLAGQEHFYLETQGCLAIPQESGGMLIISSSQNPTDVQKRVARIIETSESKVVCKVRRIGGGFGGKETKSAWIASYIGLAANRLSRPVRMAMDRDEDMKVTGSRHPFYAKWTVGFQNDGALKALDLDFYSSGGYSQDVSDAMTTKAILHLDNTYKIPNVTVRGTVCRTNFSSNTACRGTGAPQIMLIVEDMIDRVSAYLDIPPHQVRERNLYEAENQRSYFGQMFEKCPARKCWHEVMMKSEYASRREQVDQFNRQNTYTKKGISIVPTKMAVSYGCSPLEQGAALIMAYTDGSVLLTHGGVEMGQGLHTRMIQVAAQELGIDSSRIHINETSTDKVPNTTPTAASGSSDLNGKAVMDCCEKLLKRLEPYRNKNPTGTWIDWVNAAYADRVPLSATGFYRTPGLVPFNMELGSGDCYSYFTFGAAVSEIQLEVLTGTHKILRTDIVMDGGALINPAVDIGQVEGAFTFGCGLFTLEEMVYDSTGNLLSCGPGNYKLMSVQDIPSEFNVSILRASQSPRGLYSSKGLGEPPLNLAASVFLAIKDAIKAYREDKSPFRLDSPATVERIRLACEDSITKKVECESPLNGSTTRF